MTAAIALRRLRRSLARVVHTRYPAFLFGGRVPRDEIPVFTYHDVTAETLARDLEFLADNGYRTIGLDEFHCRMQDGRCGERLVLLTFDDARRSFWEVAFPLLLAHRARAALFVPTHWILSASRPAARARPVIAAPVRRDPARMFMTWEELRACARSGRVDVESHAHRHALVHVSARLAGFATPAALAAHDLFDWPMRREQAGDRCGFPPLGTPVYESAPLLSAPRRVIEPRAAVEACRRLVAANGGAAFFERPDALRRLRAVHDEAFRAEDATPVSEQELEALVRDELEQARVCFERELGRPPRFLAYPWMLGSERAQRLLKDRGWVAAFGVALDFRRLRRPSALPAYGRYKADWLRFLPGRGRQRLRDVVPRKLMSFAGTQHLAH
ncbi:MAG TPA: polysaccharide deacetylase family protein [Gammaproteobacteria bacterium]